MHEVFTLELPEDMARRARAVAAATNRRLEDALVDWIGRAVAESEVAAMTDDQVLALCDLKLEGPQEQELSSLLEQQREQEIQGEERQRLDGLLDLYRRGLLLKARALKEAVTRGLRPRLNDDAA